MTTLQMKQYLMVIVVIVLSVMFPGERSYADSSRMTVNTHFTKEFVKYVCADVAFNEIAKHGPIEGLSYASSENIAFDRCLENVFIGMNPVIN